MTHPYIDLETRDKLIQQSLESIEIISSQYESGQADTLGFFEELGWWTRETSEMLKNAINVKTAQDFNACSTVEDKKKYLSKLINRGRKRVVLS